MKKITYCRFIFLLFTFACKYQEDIALPDDIIRIQLDTVIADIPANGSTVLPFKVTLPPKTREEFKQVTFVVSDVKAGSFTGANADNVNIKAGADGIARTSFKVGMVTGTFYISAQIKSGDVIYKANQVAIVLSGISASDFLNLKADNLTPVADAESIVTVSVDSKYSTEKKVTLTSNEGTFLGSSSPKEIVVELDNQGKGTARYKVSNHPVPVNITGKFTDGRSAILSLSPQISYPERLVLETTASLADTTGKAMSMNVFLRKVRNSSKVSSGRPVHYSSFQLINGIRVSVGRFTGTANAYSDAEGNVPSVLFYLAPKDINPDLPIYIEAESDKNTNEKITANIILKVK
jgi:hypothetical protein